MIIMTNQKTKLNSAFEPLIHSSLQFCVLLVIVWVFCLVFKCLHGIAKLCTHVKIYFCGQSHKHTAILTILSFYFLLSVFIFGKTFFISFFTVLQIDRRIQCNMINDLWPQKLCHAEQNYKYIDHSILYRTVNNEWKKWLQKIVCQFVCSSTAIQ